MISASDNTAANTLIDQLGFHSINALARDLGLKRTRPGRKMLDFEARARGEDNFTSGFMISLLSAIWGGELLSPFSREFALSALERQRLDSKIPSALPPGTRILHKTGELEGIEHDAGIIILPENRACALVVLTQGGSASGNAAIRRTAALTYKTFAMQR